MCIICECEKYGVSEAMLHEAHNFLNVSNFMSYCICAANAIAGLPPFEYFKRLLLVRKIACQGDPQVEKAFSDIGLNAREYCAYQAEISQAEWVQCLHNLLTAYFEYSIMYMKYWPPVNLIEGVLELAEKNLTGEHLVRH